jgi:excisionase family DNA binding protein
MDKLEETIKRRTLTIEEAAVTLGVSKALAYEMAREGKLPTLRVGKRWLVPVVALDRLLECAA